MQVRIILCFLIVAATALDPHPAGAAGFALLEQSAVAQGTAYAGAGARADDPSTIFYNPAGITRMPGIELSTGLAGIFPQGTLVSGSSASAAGVPYAGSTGSNSGLTKLLPTFYATAQLSDRLFGGLAVTSPFGLATQYPVGSIARYYALTTQMQTVNIAPTLGWRLLPNLSAGGGIEIETADAHLSTALDLGSLLGAPGHADGIATVRGSDTALGWNIGLLYEPRPGTRVGLTYRSAVFHRLEGSVSYGGVPLPLSGLPALRPRPATAEVPEPATAALSLAQDFGRWTLLGSLTWTGWSIFHDLTALSPQGTITSVPQHFHDTLAVSVGGEYRVNDRLTLQAGTLYDPTPVRAAYRNPELPDNDRYWLSVGAIWRPVPVLALAGTYSHIFAPDATVALADPQRGTLTAQYRLSIDIVSVQATLRF